MQFWERCFDWLLDLPESFNRYIWDHLQQLDQEQAMAFVSYAEQRGLDKGLEQGIEQGLEQGMGKGLRQSLTSFLKHKHKDESAELLALLEAVSDESRLGPLCDEVFAAEGLAGVRAALVRAAGVKS